jgi:hypothetical protein
MMETEEISDTLVFISTLTLLFTPDNFNAFIRRESLKSYVVMTEAMYEPMGHSLGNKMEEGKPQG